MHRFEGAQLFVKAPARPMARSRSTSPWGVPAIPRQPRPGQELVNCGRRTYDGSSGREVQDSMGYRRRILLTAGVILATFSLWAWTAWLARGFQKAQITRTNWAFGACLLATYVSPWILHGVWTQGNPRHAAFRAILTTLLIAACLACLEVPAYFGRIHYRRFWDE